MQQRRPIGAARAVAIQEGYQQRLESLLAVDDAVASIVGALRSVGELDDTLILFTSDNGFFHGEHRVPAGKLLVYEPSIRLPLLMRGPGVPRGRRAAPARDQRRPVAHDPRRGGRAAGRAQDGRSLFDLLEDPGVQWGRELLVEGGTRPGPDLHGAAQLPLEVRRAPHRGGRALRPRARPRRAGQPACGPGAGRAPSRDGGAARGAARLRRGRLPREAGAAPRCRAPAVRFRRRRARRGRARVEHVEFPVRRRPGEARTRASRASGGVARRERALPPGRAPSRRTSGTPLPAARPGPPRRRSRGDAGRAAGLRG